MGFRNIRIVLILILCFNNSVKAQEEDYNSYHQSVINIEDLIANQDYQAALTSYQSLFASYDFIFQKDYKIAAQLAMLINNRKAAVLYIRKGMASGWLLKDFKKNTILKPLLKSPEWKLIKRDYKQLHYNYLQKRNESLRKAVKKMFSKDQWKALMAALKLSEKGQQRYLKRKFIPHSRLQMVRLKEIFNSVGYPGERIIGNDYWVSTIISHHNSITTGHTKQDTLYAKIKPILINALKKGNISPFEIATIDEWYLMTKNDDGKTRYGILETPDSDQLIDVNKMRKLVGLRTIETRNKLIQLQEDIGINFYLDGDPW